ncbi:hypothetical protein [Chlamydia sp. 17-3921]|uniref:hypothetical protein n=1 Tax=Chlamydia sp. 17-3921 TaxID=2675798 RepID=UPI00191843B6|nr:hypothetical protein [Chlamydia sp. 17-3921]
MKFLKILLPLTVWILCVSARSQVSLVTEAIGVSALRTFALSEKVHSAVEALGYGFGAPSLVNEWQAQQWLDLEQLISRSEVI